MSTQIADRRVSVKARATGLVRGGAQGSKKKKDLVRTRSSSRNNRSKRTIRQAEVLVGSEDAVELGSGA